MCSVERGHDFAIVLLALFALGRNHERVEAALAGGLDAGRVGAIGDHDRDARAGNPAVIDAVGDGDEIGAASGKKNAEVLHHEEYCSTGRLESEERCSRQKSDRAVAERSFTSAI